MQALETLKQCASERINCGDPQTIEVMYPGDAFRQGDIFIVMLESLPEAATKMDAPEGRQVAPGNTRGSRHCVEATDDVTFYRVFDGDDLSDTIVDASSAGFTLRHPEHADVTVPCGTYRIVHQQNERNERVLD